MRSFAEADYAALIRAIQGALLVVLELTVSQCVMAAAVGTSRHTRHAQRPWYICLWCNQAIAVRPLQSGHSSQATAVRYCSQAIAVRQ